MRIYATIAALAAALVLTVTASASSTGSCVTTGNNVTCTDKEWVCPGVVNLGTVTVTIDQAGSGDAVKLANGCTGSIGIIDIVQYQGDGIHVANAHDLTIGGGTIRCYGHASGKHQDGVQVLGGSNVTLDNLDVGCYSANNSQVWINNGAGGHGAGGVPTNVVFDGGRFDGHGSGSYGVSIGDSVSSGFRDATICPNAHPKREFNVLSSAVSPVNVGNTVETSCS